jgi:hypothetical protein
VKTPSMLLGRPSTLGWRRVRTAKPGSYRPIPRQAARVGGDRRKLVIRRATQASPMAVAYRQLPAPAAIDNINEGGSRHDKTDLAHLSRHLRSPSLSSKGRVVLRSNGSAGTRVRRQCCALLSLNVLGPQRMAWTAIAAIGSILRRLVSNCSGRRAL